MWACYDISTYQVWDQADINKERPTFFLKFFEAMWKTGQVQGEAVDLTPWFCSNGTPKPSLMDLLVHQGLHTCTIHQNVYILDIVI